MKYNEDEIIAELTEYVQSTYGQHYVSEESGIQTLDFLEAINLAAEFCHGNAIKYLSRFGKKGGHNRKDLLKALHYTILLTHFAEDKMKPLDVKTVNGQEKLPDAAETAMDSWEKYRRAAIKEHLDTEKDALPTIQKTPTLEDKFTEAFQVFQRIVGDATDTEKPAEESPDAADEEELPETVFKV